MAASRSSREATSRNAAEESSPIDTNEKRRAAWQFRGVERPPFAIEPEDGQESVWDYPRPPAVVADARRIEVRNNTTVLAATNAAYRVLETAGPPTIYIPPADVQLDSLVIGSATSHCEWKGSATYWHLRDTPDADPVAWSYPSPYPEFSVIRDYMSFYPGRVACFIDEERVRPQAGGFYGGWITNEIVGPIKGEPGTGGW